MPTNAFSYGCQLIFVDRGRYPRCCLLCVCTRNMRDPFWFSISSKHVVLLCRSLIKILKVNQFVCLLPRGLSPFNPHFSKILKEVQFGNSYSNDIFGNLFKWNLFEMLCIRMLTEESTYTLKKFHIILHF